MIAGLVFAPALVVSIVRRVRYPLLTSLPTALALTGFVVCYASLGLFLAAVSASLAAVCWYVLAVRR